MSKLAAAPAPTPIANPPSTDDRTIMKMAPNRMNIPAIRDTTNAAVGFSLIADPPRFCELYQNTIIKVLRNLCKRNDLSRPHLLSGGIHCLVGDSPMVQGYCVKCRAKREIKNAVAVKLKNGKPAMKGKCPVCGTTMMRIGAAK